MRSPAFFVCILLVALSLFHGCASPPPKKIPADSVRLYAELLVMYEREKLGGSVADSVYQKDVGNFFVRHGVNEEEFRKEIADISRDEIAWRNFLSETTAAVDSIKNSKPSS
ncbi:MAG TPA: hypothetical protein VMM58_07210 [Bacteroidota bacterium]|nr:hypothetical protein [Bacteroidota bacterium]